MPSMMPLPIKVALQKINSVSLLSFKTMDTTQFKTIDLNAAELEQTNGGFVFLLFAVSGALTNLAAGATLLSPLAGSAIKGWNDYE